MMNERYNHLNQFLKEKYGERVLKICIDGGFTCPNRDGTCGKGGCIFCSENGSGEHLKRKTIKEQVHDFLNSYRGERANKFIAYFQNFTNTYDSIENLKKKYDEALCDERIVALEVGTRPDCINKEIATLLSSYMDKYDVCVELGLQTSNEDIGRKINRCYTNKDFSGAVEILNNFHIPVIAHIMIGLPGDNKESLLQTVNFINSQNIQGIKIHSTYIVKNTVLEKMYNNGKYLPIGLDEYIENACFVLSHIRPDIIIHRISGDAPKSILVAPQWNAHKKWIINGIDKYLKDNNLKQGMFFHYDEDNL